jgi:hypothetical protein
MTSPRPDTRVLVATPITTDLGQWATNLTASGAGAFEDPSARMAIDGTGDGRAVEVACELDTLEASTIIEHGGDVASKPYAIRVALGVVSFDAGGGTLTTLNAPNAGVSARDYVVAWATEPNPATTGPADALRSECLVYDVASTTLAWTVVTHPVHAADVAGAFSVGGSWDGAVLQQPFGLTIDGARVSARFHSRTEVREHWVAQTPAPVVDGITAVEDSVLPADAMLAKALVGPQYQAAAASMAAGRNRHRLVSPLVQCLHMEFPTLEDDLDDAFGGQRVYDMGDGYQATVAWLVRRRIPKTCNWVLARVQWATWSDPSGVPDLVELRMHTTDNVPAFAEAIASQTISRAVDDEATGFLGVQEYFAPVKVERDAQGWTWIFLSARVNAGSPSATTRYSVREWTVTPMSAAPGFQGLQPDWG